MESKKTDRLSYIEGLKGVAACTIALVYHYGHFSPSNGLPFYNLFPELYDYGYLTVELFFMLSGFGIVLGYEHLILEDRIDFAAYLKKRISKIFPIMITSLIIITPLIGVYVYKTGNSFVYGNTYFVYYFFLHLFGLQRIFGMQASFNVSVWFISVILLCYIVFYVVVYMLRDKRNAIPYIYTLISVFGGGA